jgi:hypothetical protein
MGANLQRRHIIHPLEEKEERPHARN